jgi:DNA-binding Xre family transcriptional regulator
MGMDAIPVYGFFATKGYPRQGSENPGIMMPMGKASAKPTLNECVGRNVTVLMTHQGIKAKQLADETGLSLSSVQRVMKAQVSPTLDTLAAIAPRLGVEVWQLLIPNIDPLELPRVLSKEASTVLLRLLSPNT